MIWMLTTSAFAAEEPCYGHAHPDRHETEHFWIEWEEGSLTEAEGIELGLVMEQAWMDLVDEQGWPAPTGSILVDVAPPLFEGASGRTLTAVCADREQPRIELYPDSWEGGSDFWRTVAPHEFHHALQYVIMGNATDSIGSWLWFMEGSATWSELYAAPSDEWAVSMRRYVQLAHLQLHHGGLAFLDPDTAAHVYGTAVLASYIDQVHGGPSTIQALWDHGGTVSGERIWFPDAIEAIGLDFDTLWLDYLSRMAVLDLEVGPTIGENIPMPTIRSLPADGTVDTELRPAGLGISGVRFGVGAAVPGGELEVTFAGEPGVEWAAVLVHADGPQPGSEVLGTVPFTISAGAGVATIPFEGSGPVFLMVSPLDDVEEGQDFSWSARLLEEESKGGCGCTTTEVWGWSSWLRRR